MSSFTSDFFGPTNYAGGAIGAGAVAVDPPNASGVAASGVAASGVAGGDNYNVGNFGGLDTPSGYPAPGGGGANVSAIGATPPPLDLSGVADAVFGPILAAGKALGGILTDPLNVIVAVVVVVGAVALYKHL